MNIVYLLLLILGILLVAGSAHAQVGTLETRAKANLVVEADVVRAVLERSADVVRANAEVRRAEARLLGAQPILPSRPVLDAEAESGAVTGDPDNRFSIGISQEFEIGGQRSLRKAVAEADIAHAQSRREGVIREITFEAQLLYARTANLYEQHVLNDSLVTTSARSTQAAARRLAAGDIAQLDYNSVRLDELRQRAVHDQVHAEYESAVAELATRSGMSIDTNTRFAPTTSVDAVLSNTLNTLDSVVAQNPYWLAQEAEVRRAENELRLVHAEQIPNPTIGISVTKSTLVIKPSEITGDPSVVNRIQEIRKPEMSVSLRASIGLPFGEAGVWPTGADRAAQAEAEVDIARAEQSRIKQSIEVRTSSLRRQIVRLRRSITELREATTLAKDNALLLERGYTAGELSVTAYLTGRQQLFEAQNRSIELLREIRVAEAELQTIFATLNLSPSK